MLLRVEGLKGCKSGGVHVVNLEFRRNLHLICLVFRLVFAARVCAGTCVNYKGKRCCVFCFAAFSCTSSTCFSFVSILLDFHTLQIQRNKNQLNLPRVLPDSLGGRVPSRWNSTLRFTMTNDSRRFSRISLRDAATTPSYDDRWPSHPSIHLHRELINELPPISIIIHQLFNMISIKSKRVDISQPSDQSNQLSI